MQTGEQEMCPSFPNLKVGDLYKSVKIVNWTLTQLGVSVSKIHE